MIFGGKIERIYFAAKGLVFIPLALWVYLNPWQAYPVYQFPVLLLIYLAINLFMYRLSAKRYIKGSNLMFALSPVDAVFLYFIVSYYGGVNSQANLSYYLLVVLLSIYLPMRKVIIIASFFTISYVCSTLTVINTNLISSILMKTSFIWLAAAIGSIISHYMKSSEQRLLKTLDVLNERTWEVESSQVMLENMYETTRVLASILDLNQLLKEILKIADELLQVRRLVVLLSESSGKSLSKYAELFKGKRTLHDPPVYFSEMHYAEKTGGTRINDLTETRITISHKYQILELPLISHCKTIGLLYLELHKKEELSEKERKNFRIFANSAAISIDNALMHAKLQELTIIDELTTLYNYRHFRNKLEDEIRRADRYQQQLSLLMIDVDHFKRLNDSQGHQAGNVILQEIAGIIKHSVRDVDIVARFGGEEFMVILPQTKEKDALVIAERMRSQIDNSYFPNSKSQRDIKVTVSIGVAVYPDGIASSNQLLERVDQALYLAKKDGRNKIHLLPSAGKETKEKMVQ